jgi:hypothetical protein
MKRMDSDHTRDCFSHDSCWSDSGPCCYRVMNQFAAAKMGDLPQLRVTLTADNVNVPQGGGWTALHWAARDGHDECVKYCIEMGANVNARSIGGYTPLHFALLYERVTAVKVVRVLLDAGASVDMIDDDDGWTPLHRAICTNRVDVARMLIDRGAKLCNVLLDENVPKIPDWVTIFMESRAKCRCAAIVIVGIHEFRRTTVTGNNDINVFKLISKHIWSMRMDDMWVGPPIEATRNSC